MSEKARPTADVAMQSIGMIAGNGRFPLSVAHAARARGVRVIAVAHEGETLPELAQAVDQITWIKVGELERMFAAFHSAGAERALMAGGIRKAALLDHFAPDARGLQFLARVAGFGDDALLRGLADELHHDGIEIIDSTVFLADLLAPRGALAIRQPTDDEWKDIRYGTAVAKALGQFDIGQSVVVHRGMVLAVEAIEGTDATIQRGGRPGAVVVKVSKPQQDLRFDVPAIGPNTVRVCVAAGVSVLAVEAGKTLLLDRDELVRTARADGLCLVGVEEDD